MTDALAPMDARATARGAGLALDDAAADRIAIALSPAIAGFTPIAATLPFDLEPAAFHANGLRARPDDYGAQVRARLENGSAIPAVTYLEALRWRGPALAAHLEAVVGIDAVLAPATPTPAPTITETDVGGSAGAEAMIQRITRFTRPVNYLGLPAVSLPCGFSRAGLPIGLQAIGAPFTEALLIRLGAAFQRETDFHEQMPQVPA